MSDGDNTPRPLALDQLPDLRRKTETISKYLKDQLARHLETLRPLLELERVFGRHAGGKVDFAGAEVALEEIKQSHKNFTAKPFDLPAAFEVGWLTLVGKKLELHPWTYQVAIQNKNILMTAPVKWVLNYSSEATLAQVKNALAGTEKVQTEHVRQFVVNALALQRVLKRNAGLVQLLHDLRFDLKIETLPELKNLPLATLTAKLTSFRPADALVAAATAFSGISAFIELVDLDAVQSQPDPWWQGIEEALK